MTENKTKSAGLDASKLSPVVKTPRVDANDYSRFDKIELSDDEQESDKPVKVKNVVSECRNCYKQIPKMKCSICKKASYCNRKCQLEDWTYHKRICKKPEVAKEDPRKQASPTTSKSSARPKTNNSEVSKKNIKSDDVVVEDTELGDARGYKNGLPYFHRELSSHEKQLIGDTAPKKMESSGVEPINSGSAHGGSAWNAAGTFEERNYTNWAQRKLSDMLVSMTYAEGGIKAKFEKPKNMTGEASICVVRFKKRYLFDFSFELPFEVVLENDQVYKGSFQMNEISNDAEYEISYKLIQPGQNATIIRKFVGEQNFGLQREAMRVIEDFFAEFQRQ